MKKASSVILRIGIAAVIIWFGYQQLSDPTSWLGFLPPWAATLPISQLSLIYLNGWFEIVAGTMLFFGIYTRAVALFIALHLADITVTVGYGAIGVRDFGLTVAMISIFFYGSSPVSIDMFFREEPCVSLPSTRVPEAPLPSRAKQNYFTELAKSRQNPTV